MVENERKYYYGHVEVAAVLEMVEGAMAQITTDPNLKSQAFKVHNLRNNTWYVVDEKWKIVSPVCKSMDQLRLAEAMICMALQGDVTEVDE